MKILNVCDRTYPYFKGGAEKRSWDISKSLVKKGHEITYISGKWPEMKNNEEKIDNLNIKGIYKIKQFYKDGKKSISESIKFTLKVLPNILKEDFDLLDSDQFPVMHIPLVKLACIIKRKPLILTWHEAWGKEYWQEYIGTYKGYLGYLIERLSVKLPNKIIAVSNFTKNQLIERLGVKSDKIEVIPNAINLDLINKVKHSKEKSDFIFAGRLLSHKNVDLLINSVNIIKKSNKKYNNIKCIIIGDGPEMNNLKKLTKELSLNKNIIFKGFVKREEDVYSLMKSSKVLAFPSEREGFGITAIEALACALPVVTIDGKDNASKFLISSGKTGYMTKKQEDSYSRSLKKALHAYNSMKSTCKQEAKKYDLKQVIKQVEEVYKKAI